jgi:Mrp family chromosome partitioning ATPase
LSKLLSSPKALLNEYASDSAYVIAYQTLYTNISLNWDRANAKQPVLLFTIPMSSPRLALAAANLAIAAAQNGRPTLLVDANLSAPQVGQLFGSSATVGLYDLLANPQQSIDSAISATQIPDLYLLGAGQKHPATQEYHRLFSTRLAATITQLRTWHKEKGEQASLIILNGPAVLQDAASLQLAALADQTFLILVAGRTTQTQARRAQEQLERAQARLAGSILLDI